MTKILVTGASGFIGKALVEKFLKQGHDITGLSSTDGDIAEAETLKALAGTRFKHVIHLAGRSYVPDSWGNPVLFYRTNVIGTANVLEFCRTFTLPVTFVSAYVYGQPASLPISEDCPVRPNNPYAHSKYMAEKLCKFYAEEHNLDITVIRPFNIYGADQKNWFLVPSVIKQVLYEDSIIVRDLHPKRDYLYLEDFIEAVCLMLKEPHGYRVYNIGSGTSISVEQVIETVQNIYSCQKKIICEFQSRKNEIDDVIADISRAKRELGWIPRHSFSDGIQKVLTWELLRQTSGKSSHTDQQG